MRVGDEITPQATLTNDRLLSMSKAEVWAFFAPHMLPMKWSEDMEWLTYEDILGGYFDRLRVAGRSGLSSRDTESTVAMKGAKRGQAGQEEG